ncbi:unnamed protein product [Paramecium primaurelia]|uniref:Uncharacterized protein n=1 Tax=Paramecium primaurelia TaxID=5886 RepID=A0A8S1M9I8_PARPR|nr:unnamed protein product [Paramecium primaurelia]
MYENDVIQVTQSYDLTYIFWDVKTEQQNQDINYRDKLIVNRIDTSKEKKYQAAAINFFDSYYNEISQIKKVVYIQDRYNNNIIRIGFFQRYQFRLYFF